MRLLFASDSSTLDRNGSVVAMARIAREMGHRGHRVWIASPLGLSELDETGAIVETKSAQVRPPAYLTTGLSSITRVCEPRDSRRFIRDVLTRTQPDLVNSHSPFTLGANALTLASFRGIPAVGSHHLMPDNITANFSLSGAFERGAKRSIWRQIERGFGAALHVTTPSLYGQYELAANTNLKNITVLSNGVPSTPHPRATNPSTLGRLRLIYTGRLDADKRVGDLIRAATEFRDVASLVVVGGGARGPHLRRETKRLRVDDIVEFTGQISDPHLASLMSKSQAFVMPSGVELQSLATLEAMSHGLPAIAPNAGALPELVLNDHNGLLHALGDTHSIATKVRDLATKPVLRQRLSEGARATALDHHVESVGNDWEALFQQAASERRRPLKPA